MVVVVVVGERRLTVEMEAIRFRASNRVDVVCLAAAVSREC